MNNQDPIADMLTRIRNANRVGRRMVLIPKSKICVGIAEVRKCHSPRLVDGFVCAGHRDIAKMSSALESRVITDEKFPAPDGAVGSVTCPVKRDADHGFVQAMLGHAACHVGVMMLNGDALHAFFGFPPARGSVAAVVLEAMRLEDEHNGRS